MRSRLATPLIPFALALLTAGASSAQANLVAGWDFSQYAGDGFMSVDGGSTFTNTLSANYSDLDRTLGCGLESAAFGTMFADGQFGSTSVSAGSGTEQFVPIAAVGGSLASNLDAPSQVDFDAFSVLQSEGQVSANSLAMIAAGACSIVFQADLRGVGRTGTNWALSLGGRTFSGTSSVGVEYSTNGSAYTSFGTANLTTADSLFSFNLGTASTNLAFVRLTFNPSGADQPLIDNLAITAVLSAPPQCSDGVDNDGDGLTDYPSDPACRYPTSTSENTQCQDGLDNDGDGKRDYDGGASRGVNPPTAPDPQCTAAWKDKEAMSGGSGGACGVGPELIALLSLIGTLRRRNGRARGAA